MTPEIMKQKDDQIKGLIAQLEAHKQMLNEQLQFGVNLRTNMILFQQTLQEVNAKNAEQAKEMMNKDIPVQQRPRRVIVMIDNILPRLSGRIIIVAIPRWREHGLVKLAEGLFPKKIRDRLKIGTILTATVNAEADKAEELYFKDFRLIPGNQ